VRDPTARRKKPRTSIEVAAVGTFYTYMEGQCPCLYFHDVKS
jgi:hypothetical protein